MCGCLCVAAWRFETPQQVQFVEKLSDVVIGQLPNFWKLWISYVNGSLFSEVNTWDKTWQETQHFRWVHPVKKSFLFLYFNFYLFWLPVVVSNPADMLISFSEVSPSTSKQCCLSPRVWKKKKTTHNNCRQTLSNNPQNTQSTKIFPMKTGNS